MSPPPRRLSFANVAPPQDYEPSGDDPDADADDPAAEPDDAHVNTVASPPTE